MNTQVTKLGNATLPALGSMASALKKNVASIASTGAIILKFDKVGSWVFGADADEVEEGSGWAVNPYSFSHGYIAWGDGEPVGEKMVSMTEDLPDPGPLPLGADEKGWQLQVGIQLKCLSGADKGMEVRFSTSSAGGKRAVQALGMAVAEQIKKDPGNPVAIVMLETDSYKHKQYGKVFVPVFAVDSFTSMDAPEAVTAKVEAKPEPVQETTARRRRG